MHLTNDKHDDELIDLGTVVEETKGGAPQGFDGSLGQRQQGISGIADD